MESTVRPRTDAGLCGNTVRASPARAAKLFSRAVMWRRSESCQGYELQAKEGTQVPSFAVRLGTPFECCVQSSSNHTSEVKLVFPAGLPNLVINIMYQFPAGTAGAHHHLTQWRGAAMPRAQDPCSYFGAREGPWTGSAGRGRAGRGGAGRGGRQMCGGACGHGSEGLTRDFCRILRVTFREPRGSSATWREMKRP
ncbi:hypothetical protein E2C01_013746 [Portunus trituberculatus]|uniref:Uncharacterized protein n=1 Tax=Portunus trituberculatus TaxID=210409 RepID=A0A5B7DI98_PORTR|nr:hypothetical protein [Portunus trituberculatus]